MRPRWANGGWGGGGSKEVCRGAPFFALTPPLDTTKTRSDPQRVRMSSGKRSIGTAEALCHPPPPSCESNARARAPGRCCFRNFWNQVLLCPLSKRPPPVRATVGVVPIKFWVKIWCCSRKGWAGGSNARVQSASTRLLCRTGSPFRCHSCSPDKPRRCEARWHLMGLPQRRLRRDGRAAGHVGLGVPRPARLPLPRLQRPGVAVPLHRHVPPRRARADDHRQSACGAYPVRAVWRGRDAASVAGGSGGAALAPAVLGRALQRRHGQRGSVAAVGR